MPDPLEMQRYLGRFAIVVAFVLFHCVALSGAFAQSLIVPAPADPSTAEPQSEIPISPHARDIEITDRLTRILDASGWFTPAIVSVREGIVFLDGQTQVEYRKDWARQLALRMQGVVAVVNRIEVKPEINWDLTPTWREIERLVDQAKSLAPIVVVSVLILLVSWMISRGVVALAVYALRPRIRSPLLLSIVARSLAFPVILIAVYLVLQVAGLTRLAITLLGGTGLVGIIIGLAFRDIAGNTLASILLSTRSPFRVGDWIRIGGNEGIVQNLNMRTTVLLTLDGNHIQIPNSLVFDSVITNFSTNPGRRTDFIVGIGYTDSIAHAQAVVIRALRAHPAVLDDPEPAALVEALATSTVDIRVQFWFDGTSYSIFKVRSALMRQVKLALQDAGISMPDPAREVIFPDGVPVRRVSATQRASETGPQAAAAPGEGDAANVAAGEGDLGSDKDELNRQGAAGANVPGAGENLLTSGNPQAGTG